MVLMSLCLSETFIWRHAFISLLKQVDQNRLPIGIIIYLSEIQVLPGLEYATRIPISVRMSNKWPEVQF